MYEVIFCDRLQEAHGECYRLRCDIAHSVHNLMCADGVEREITEVVGVLDAGREFILPGSDEFIKKGARYGILVKVNA